MEILTARFGFCIGIARAYRGFDKLAARTAATLHVAHQNGAGEFDTLARIERQEPELLAQYPHLAGVAVAKDVDTLGAGDRLALGFHGLPPRKKAELAARGVDLVDDLMCPFIAKLDRVVERMAGEGFDIAIVGHRDNHHCRTAQQLAEEQGRQCHVIETAADIADIPTTTERPLALVGQVTGNTVTFAEVIARMQRLPRPVKVVKTMCSDSHTRQKTAIELAKQADVVLLIDDGGGAAESVYEVCARTGARIHRIRAKTDVRAEWLKGVGTLAIIGGILVPDWTIDEIAAHARALGAASALA